SALGTPPQLHRAGKSGSGGSRSSRRHSRRGSTPHRRCVGLSNRASDLPRLHCLLVVQRLASTAAPSTPLPRPTTTMAPSSGSNGRLRPHGRLLLSKGNAEREVASRLFGVEKSV